MSSSSDGFSSGLVSSNIGITSPFFTSSSQSAQYTSPVYPSFSVVASTAFLTSVFLWFAGLISPNSSPQTSHTAFAIQVASPPVCPFAGIVVPSSNCFSQSVQYKSPVYPSSVQVASTASSSFVFL